MPRPTDMLSRTPRRRIVLVAQAPNRVQRGVALSDGEQGGPEVNYFEVLERRNRDGFPWVHLQNMVTGAAQWFRLEDAGPLRIAGSAAAIREKNGWPTH